jgi:hypothetical protein
MPRGDRTGPSGMGPTTGRGRGFCAVYGTPGFADTVSARSFFGRGGRGRRNRFFATGLAGWMRSGMGFGPFGKSTPIAEEELRQLKQETDNLEKYLNGIRDRISRMKTESEA